MELSELGVELEVGLRSQGHFPVPRLELLVRQESTGGESGFTSAESQVPMDHPTEDIRLIVGYVSGAQEKDLARDRFGIFFSRWMAVER